MSLRVISLFVAASVISVGLAEDAMASGSLPVVADTGIYGHVECDECSLFDLSTDPYEENDMLMSRDDGDGEVQSIVDSFLERIDYWTEFYQPAREFSVDKSGWKSAGGVMPWNTTDFEPLNVEVKYSATNAPHIVYVLVDDWGWNNLGSRSTFMSWVSPTIDSLMEEGVSFSNYYSNELCTPSRASLMTGRYAFRFGFQNATDENSLHSELDLSEVTIAQEMQSAGYKTYLIGKWVSDVLNCV
jgi:hypothetical protein